MVFTHLKRLRKSFLTLSNRDTRSKEHASSLMQRRGGEGGEWRGGAGRGQTREMEAFEIASLGEIITQNTGFAVK